jgi:hypothetical protein
MIDIIFCPEGAAVFIHNIWLPFIRNRPLTNTNKGILRRIR